jgi:hypothetical protein
MSKDDRSAVDREFRRLGFGGLDDPNLIPQIAFFIRNHDHFRSQLFSVLPEKRREAYNALRPHLRFTPKPLDVYEAEMKEYAERMQLPGFNPATGELVPFKAGSVDLDLIATEAIKQNKHEKDGGLQLTCKHCLTVEVFRAKIRKMAEKDAQAAGWRSAGDSSWCPKHVPTRVTMRLLCSNCSSEEKLRAWDEQDGYAKARLMGWKIGDTAECRDCSAKALVLQ